MNTSFIFHHSATIADGGRSLRSLHFVAASKFHLKVRAGGKMCLDKYLPIDESEAILKFAI